MSTGPWSRGTRRARAAGLPAAVCAAAAFAGALSLTGGVAAGAVRTPAGSVSAPALVAASLAAARAATSVGYTSTAVAGTVSETFLGSAGRRSGVQRIATDIGRLTGNATIIVSNGVAYVKGDSLSLTALLNMGNLYAGLFADKWLKVTSRTKAYASLAAGVTLSSLLDEVVVRPPLTYLGQTTFDGRPVYEIAGSGNGLSEPVAAKVALFIAARGTPLPVERLEATGSGRTVTTLGPWNKKLAVSPPAGSVPVGEAGVK